MCDSKLNKAHSARPSHDRNAQDNHAITDNMARIRHKVIVMSGKGGVGKSTVAVNLAVSLAARGLKTGLLDIDIHGPSVPRLLGLDAGQVTGAGGRLMPVEYNGNLKVISIGFLLQEQDQAVIWRGPLKYSVIKQFLGEVEWGDLDYLVIDSPPGTGDEPLSICQLIQKADGAVIVTTPQDVALIDVRKSVNFCKQLGMPILGVIENMSGFVCPHCGKETDIFKSGGGRTMAEEMGVPYLGHIPLDARIVADSDSGKPLHTALGTETTQARKNFLAIVDSIVQTSKK
jgi:ATP-binding protein involved in chromosome partitioning